MRYSRKLKFSSRGLINWFLWRKSWNN